MSALVSAVDYHTAGEPFRIVTGGVEALRGETILAKRRDAAERLDHVRRLLVHEPRGHADMYGCHVVEPEPGGDLGVVFFHNAGYSTACGHGTIALATAALELGMVPAREPVTELALDVPSGRLAVRIEVEGGRPGRVSFVNVPSYVEAQGIAFEGLDLIRTDESGRIKNLTVMVRPLSGLIALAEAMSAKVGHLAK